MKLSLLFTFLAAVSAFTTGPKASKSTTALNMAKFRSAMQYVPCITLDQLPSPGSATSGVAGGLAICIAVDENGSVYALGDKCPPINQPLSFGKVANGCITDPVLGTAFDLKTGEVSGPWCPGGIGKLIGGAFTPEGVPVFPVKQSKGAIEVQVDVNAKFNFEANFWSGVLDAQGKADGKYY